MCGDYRAIPPQVQHVVRGWHPSSYPCQWDRTPRQCQTRSHLRRPRRVVTLAYGGRHSLDDIDRSCPSPINRHDDTRMEAGKRCLNAPHGGALRAPHSTREAVVNTCPIKHPQRVPTSRPKATTAIPGSIPPGSILPASMPRLPRRSMRSRSRKQSRSQTYRPLG
jgi:hypothetical protein